MNSEFWTGVVDMAFTRLDSPRRHAAARARIEVVTISVASVSLPNEPGQPFRPRLHRLQPPPGGEDILTRPECIP